jgi:ABC-type uncharacterized transport system permease subunit
VFSLTLIFVMNVVPFTICLALAVRDAGWAGLWRSYREAAWLLGEAAGPTWRALGFPAQ